MPRVVKNADVRRRELLDTALRLFETAGYERTSIDQITAEVGVAKGTFYHYFSSKQDLLEQLVGDYAEDLFGRLEAELAATESDAVSRLRMLFARSASIKMEDRDATLAFARSLYSEENLRLRHALMAEWLPRTDALLAPVIAAGIAEGVFDVTDAEATATVLTSLWFGWGDRRAGSIIRLDSEGEGIERASAELSAVEAGMERILGVTEGSLGLGLTERMTRLMEDR